MSTQMSTDDSLYWRLYVIDPLQALAFSRNVSSGDHDLRLRARASARTTINESPNVRRMTGEQAREHVRALGL